jgi:hypothetical protein
MKHSQWRRGDPLYSDLSFYDQIHYSLGFWHLVHVISEFIVSGAAIALLVEAHVMTQFLSGNVLRFFSIAVLLSYVVGCRWLSILPGLYQVILVIRVSFVRLVSLTIGIIPLAMACMFFGIFAFGFVSNMTTSFQRFFRCFYGLVFGDEVFDTFAFFSDQGSLYEAMSFIFGTVIVILAAYVFFPAFTATITFLHKHDVIPIQREEEARMS